MRAPCKASIRRRPTYITWRRAAKLLMYMTALQRDGGLPTAAARWSMYSRSVLINVHIHHTSKCIKNARGIKPVEKRISSEMCRLLIVQSLLQSRSYRSCCSFHLKHRVSSVLYRTLWVIGISRCCSAFCSVPIVRVLYRDLCTISGAGADHPETPRPGGRGKMAISRCKGAPERALSIVKRRIRWRTGRVKLETAT